MIFYPNWNYDRETYYHIAYDNPTQSQYSFEIDHGDEGVRIVINQYTKFLELKLLKIQKAISKNRILDNLDPVLRSKLEKALD